MMPASSKAGGMYFAMPDVCLTPAPPSPSIPTPYPNIAQLASTSGAVTKVLIENKETVVEGNKVSRSNGDEAGTDGGVTSGCTGGQVEPKVFSSKVFFDGKKPVFLTSMSAHNGTNANAPTGAQIVPSQLKVFVAP